MFALTTGAGRAMSMLNIGLVQMGPALVPILSVSMEQHAVAAPFFPKSLVCGMPVQNFMTMGMMTNGCVGPGVKSGTMMGLGRNLIPSACVFYGGAPAVNMMSPTLQNLTNALGMNMGPDQTIVSIAG